MFTITWNHHIFVPPVISINKASDPLRIPPGPSVTAPDNPLQFLLGLVREYGDTVCYDNPYGRVFFFNHPDQVQSILTSSNYVRTPLVTLLLGQGLLSSDGEFWRSQRRLMQPMFHEHCLPGFASVVTEKTLSMLLRWERTGVDRKPVDFAIEMRRLTLEVIVQALFSVELGSEAEEWSSALSILMDDLSRLSSTQFNIPSRIDPFRNVRHAQASKILEDKVQFMIDERRNLKDKPRDLLTLLVSTTDEKTGRTLTTRQIRDEVLTMLVGGHETTAIILGWTWQLLAENPEVEQRMTSEVHRELQSRVPTFEDLAGLSYTRMLLEETMRLYPPVWFTVRQAAAEGEVSGYRIPARTIVLLSAYTTHRHPDFWENPDCFDPGRFAPEKGRVRHRGAFFPFSGGRHVCLGQSFAMMESQLVLALLIQRCRIKKAPGQKVEPEAGITLRLRPSLMVTAEQRVETTAAD